MSKELKWGRNKVENDIGRTSALTTGVHFHSHTEAYTYSHECAPSCQHNTNKQDTSWITAKIHTKFTSSILLDQKEKTL